MRRLTIGLVGGALAITACGGGSDSADSGRTTPAVAEAPAEEAPADSDFTETPAEPDTGGDEASAPVDDTTPPVTTLAPGAEPAESAPSEDAAAPAPENEPTTTLAPEPAAAPLGGRSLGQALRAESAADSNPLPDLLVDDIRAGTQVNVANILPSALPVLIWAWAPH